MPLLQKKRTELDQLQATWLNQLNQVVCKTETIRQIGSQCSRSVVFLFRICTATSPCLAPPETKQSKTQNKSFDPFAHLGQQPAEKIWERYFQEKHTDAQIRKVIQRLQKKRNFKQIIAALQAALLAGQPQPWMYEVLALSMEIEKYPKKDVERMLLSMTDFSATDIPNLLGSAAYLVRLKAPAQALKLYRQVSEIQPTRPEPYLLGLNLAVQLEQVDSILWAATGILTYYWFDDYKTQHEKALSLLAETELKLEKSNKIKSLEALRKSRAQAMQRDLQLKLEWSGEADLDLVINEPLGTTCSFSNRYTQSGGALLHEGAGPKQENCYEQYVCAIAASGYYTVTVSHSTGKIVGNRARLTVTRYAGTKQESREKVNVIFDKANKKFRISLHQGRRMKKNPVYIPIKETSRAKQKRTHMQLLSLRNSMSRQQPWLNQIRTNPAGAVGYSPVIVPVTSGSSLTASAVVSADRRYVRIGIEPRFTNITDVFTFSFVNGGQ